MNATHSPTHPIVFTRCKLVEAGQVQTLTNKEELRYSQKNLYIKLYRNVCNVMYVLAVIVECGNCKVR